MVGWSWNKLAPLIIDVEGAIKRLTKAVNKGDRYGALLAANDLKDVSAAIYGICEPEPPIRDLDVSTNAASEPWWKDSHCPLCASTDFEVLPSLKGRGKYYCKCNNCGTPWHRP